MSTVTTQDRPATTTTTPAALGPQAAAQLPAAPKSRRNQAVEDALPLLNKIMQDNPNASGRVIVTYFQGTQEDGTATIETLRVLLPDAYKSQAERFVRRGAMYLGTKEELIKCTLKSKLQAILDAGEMGFALDGEMCYAVPYCNTKTDAQGRKYKEDEVQCQASYFGLTELARRTGQIVDIYGDVVCEGDQFKHGRQGPVSYLEHSYDHTHKRGAMQAAYVIIKLPGGDWRYELMVMHDLQRIRNCSKAPNSPAWKTHEEQMHLKTVLRRSLKLYKGDPGVAKAIALDERDYGDDDGEWINPAAAASRAQPSGLNDMLGRRAAAQQEAAAAGAGRELAAARAQEAIETLPEFGDATHEAADQDADDDLEPTGTNQGTQASSNDDFEMGVLALHYEALLNKRDINRAENAQLRMDISNAYTRGELNQDEAGHLQRMVARNANEIAQRQLQQQ